DALFPEYLKTKKLENMINPADFVILSLYHPELEKQDPIFDFMVKNYDRYCEAVDKEEVQNYLIGLYNTHILKLCSTGKTDYKQTLERINGDLKAIYADMPFGDLSAVEAVTLLADSYSGLFRHNLPVFFENMDKYFAGAGKSLGINDYTQPIEDLYSIYQGNLPDQARPLVIKWINNTLNMKMAPQLRTRLLMLLAENLQKTGDTTKAKQSLNQAFIVSAEIEEPALKVQLQNMIRENLENL
ncbi:MAG: thioredoxin, partial [Odoribacter sp.]|nr:thioredoxin [Odoribacter sp.]